MTYHRIGNWSNMTGAISETRTAFPSGTPEFSPVFSGVSIDLSLFL